MPEMSVVTLPLHVNDNGDYPESDIHLDVHIIIFDDERVILFEWDYIPVSILPLKTNLYPVVNNLVHL